jgi:hypothetical protein
MCIKAKVQTLGIVSPYFFLSFLLCSGLVRSGLSGLPSLSALFCSVLFCSVSVRTGLRTAGTYSLVGTDVDRWR